jgi:hypothetical protein
LTFPAAVVAAVLSVTTVFAVATWAVRPGGPVSLTSGALTWTDAATRANVECASSRFSGMLKSGSGLSGTGIGSITAGGFPICSNALGPNFVLTVRDLPWQVNVTSYNATKGIATGSVRHIQITVVGPGWCSAVIRGIATFHYTNSTAKLKPLTTGGNLNFANVSGCAGLFRTGDPVTLSSNFTVSPKQAITSP